ncbi:MAG TPA: DUF502 domain-containing protein [Gemmatimonadaceae bacterium]|nr:DUF502 domain-containing protein [Gemmatimonadaceae bacterium]
MRALARYFLRGLVVSAPVALTLYVCWAVFERLDRWLGLPVPGAGFVLTLALITLVGFLASNLVTRGVVAGIERAMQHLPFVRLLYTSTKDLLNAFVGEQRRFDRPVAVTLFPGTRAKALGFVTADALEQLGLAGYVAVYLPQSYNFAGSLLLFPADQVEPLAAESAEVLAFIVSGGVSGGSRGAAAPRPAAPRSLGS